ncbi:MAG: NAD(P)-dependent glycerol-3-phosphate dehydrogenase [Deltaproteobacteria bacterium]|nr:NAD(P)-dependent glycerol-3-phosphate dehydrogenase [Deltaproteobacteria bacterium]
MEKIGVLGAGTWGTTLANLLAENGFEITLWVRREELCYRIIETGENSDYLPGIKLSDRIHPTTSLEEAIEDKAIVVCAIPSHGVRHVLIGAKGFFKRGVIVVSASKGIEEEGLLTVSQVLKEVLQKGLDIAVLSGPSFAREVSLNLPTAVVIASENKGVAERCQQVFSARYFRVYTSQDVVGVELGGALKNVIAISAGVSDGLGLGLNARAALITRGLAEISRLGVKKGASLYTFSGLSGLGDLVLTCTGELSRNRRVGVMRGKGHRLEEVLAGMREVAEGVKTTRAAYGMAKRFDVEMPITEEVYKVLYEGKTPKDAVWELMGRGLKGE